MSSDLQKQNGENPQDLSEATPNLGPSVEDLCLLANTFTEQGMIDKAILIYESACRIFPNNLALKINLGRVRSLKKRKFEDPSDFLQEDIEREAEKKIGWSNRFAGLAEVYIRSGRKEEAEAVLNLTKQNAPGWYLPHLQLGRFFLESGRFGEAIDELEEGRKLNPFNEEISDLLGASRLQNRDYAEALKCAIDASILSGELSQGANGRYRSKIKHIVEKLSNFSDDARKEMIRERRNRIQALYETLEEEMSALPDTAVFQKKDRDLSHSPVVISQPHEDSEKQARTQDDLYALASRLKQHLIFRNMDDEAVMKVARFSSQIHIQTGDFVYQESDPIYGLYLIDKGKIEIQKTTSFGPISYVHFEKGSFFGDDDLLGGRSRYTSAMAVQESDLLFIDKAGLANIFAREKAIAIHFLWYFWKSLSFQVRESNDRMTSFFAGASQKERKEILRKSSETTGTPTHIEIDRKLEVLQAKGLSTGELSLLAKLSNEEIYNAGETVFREGDLGNRLFIVLEGAVLISKQIPGIGEEALAVLNKGDFFGEMALVGQHHRSADAKAQEQGTTLLVVSKETLREILSIDNHSAYQFLTILCHILSKRLREMNEKIYHWRMMSGGF